MSTSEEVWIKERREFRAQTADKVRSALNEWHRINAGHVRNVRELKIERLGAPMRRPRRGRPFEAADELLLTVEYEELDIS